MRFFPLVASVAALGSVSMAMGSVLSRQSNSATGYSSPARGGGRMLTYNPSIATNIGEPINVIISNASDRFVLTREGFLEWASSVQLIPNACIVRDNVGGSQQADLGDGNGRKNQTDVLRHSYFTDNTCKETVQGGNHARYWRQNGTSADSSAWFLAASVEMALAQGHDIVDNGFDLGRNWIAGNATMSNGTLSTGGYVFQATSTNAPLLHGFSTSDINHNIAIDGNVAVITVRVISNGTSTISDNTSSSSGNTGQSGDSGSGKSGAASAATATAGSPSLPAIMTLGTLLFGAMLLTGSTVA
ncbi:unnamed protein product [Tilletia laevis]|uniref:Uncharacterized protein n=3 Tax=Tilletia TaxID=13289 RepID=A0A9N8LR30_9BASI|nr:hypothetical protein CF336_g4232 [Tilletia laevis]KAE8257130.1 hypothetical protein A4X03_0g4769 [Tilletia caries]KAE8208389.1 hypothetical protein CF335_g448 [Tilletia laevis]CAD6888294.1 unnamed protein product [Tilletia caries]CAD6916834.1 unnamed protein product [Tilletia laevis]